MALYNYKRDMTLLSLPAKRMKVDMSFNSIIPGLINKYFSKHIKKQWIFN